MGMEGKQALEAKLQQLISQRKDVEDKINSYGEILSNNANVGMTGNLVDSNGYPRNDIDIYKVRQARQQIICLQNDHKALMNQIEGLLHKLHSITRNEADQAASEAVNHTERTRNSSDESENNSDTEITLLKPIVQINHVALGSPAEEAGLRNGDRIINFGSIKSSNFNNDLQTIANVVNHMQNQRIPLKVLRQSDILNIVLIPKTWSGRGILGCNIILSND